MPRAVTSLEVHQVCKLLQCVRAKDKQQIEKLTDNGIPHLINYNDVEGSTALMIAAIANDHDMIEFLLDLGAHPDIMDFQGRTPAMRAAEYGHVPSLRALANADADMTLTDAEGKGILFYLITNTVRHMDCLEMVLPRGADVNNTTKDGTPVFLQACEMAAENEEMCMKMLELGADPNSRIELSYLTPDKGKPQKMKKAVRIVRTALMAACGSGSVKVVRTILTKGGLVNILDVRKNHAAHFAARNGHLECLKCLAGYQAEFDLINMEGNTPIHMAAMGGHAMCCKYLAQRGCNPKPKNSDGFTARALAKEEGYRDAAKEIRKSERSFGKTGKHNEPWALRFYDWLSLREEKVLGVLKKYDLEDTGIIHYEELSRVIAMLRGPIEEHELMKLLRPHKNRDGNLNYAEFVAAKRWINKHYLTTAFQAKKKKVKGKKGGKRRGKFKLVMPICTQEEGGRTAGGGPPAMYLPRHVNFTDTTRFDRDHPPAHPIQDDTPWYLRNPPSGYVSILKAAKTGDFDSLKKALERKVPVDTRDKFYKTALMTACAAGHIAMAKFLVEQGAAVNARDNFKWTPLHHACHAGLLDVVQFLVENGAELDATTMSGGTPLTRAIESSQEEVVRYLIERGAKVQTETTQGMTPMDIAQAWANPKVLRVVEEKWESLPSLDSIKKKKKKNAKAKGRAGSKGKRPQSAPGEKDGDSQVHHRQKPPWFDDGAVVYQRAPRPSGRDVAVGEYITYTPLRAWIRQNTTRELIREKGVRRERFGWEVDFPDFQMPFQKNISTKLDAMEEE